MIFGVMIMLVIAGMVIYSHTGYFAKLNILSVLVSAISICFAIIMLIGIIVAHVGVEGTRRKYEEQYNGIMYKMQTSDCRDEFGILNKEFVDEIQTWNMTVASNQAWRKDFWVGIFFSPAYDDLKLIDMNEFSYKTSD